MEFDPFLFTHFRDGARVPFRRYFKLGLIVFVFTFHLQAEAPTRL